jgi:hypothetical protein
MIVVIIGLWLSLTAIIVAIIRGESAAESAAVKSGHSNRFIKST